MQSKEDKIKLFLVDDHDVVRQGLKMVLLGHSGFEVIGEAGNGKEAVQKIRDLKPTVVLMDINMPVMNGIDATRRIKTEYPEIKVLAVTMHEQESYLLDLLEAGAEGYVLKSTSPEELAFAIHKIATGGMYMDPEFTVKVLTKYRASYALQTAEKKSKVQLSEKETVILNLVAEGYTNTEMAQKLCTSIRTIETRRKRLLVKTGTTNTATLIKFAVLNGFVK